MPYEPYTMIIYDGDDNMWIGVGTSPESACEEALSKADLDYQGATTLRQLVSCVTIMPGYYWTLNYSPPEE